MKIDKWGHGGTLNNPEPENVVQLPMFGEQPAPGVNTQFQTPLPVCKYMSSWVRPGVKTILEPTPGMRNLSQTLIDDGYSVTEPENYFLLDPALRFDCVVMNPPFSRKWAYGLPENYQHYGMRLGYQILIECMEKTNDVVALMPWFTISDSDLRLRHLKEYGLRAIIALPRKTFRYARIQTTILVLRRGWNEVTEFHTYDFPKKGGAK
jgi:hypothetical protein